MQSAPLEAVTAAAATGEEAKITLMPARYISRANAAFDFTNIFESMSA